MSKNNDLKSVMVRLEPEVYDSIPVTQGSGGRSVRGGVAGWITHLIHDHLGCPPPHINRPLEDPDLSHVDPSKLDPRMRLVVSLYQEGRTMKDLVQTLQDRKVATPRGGKWDVGSLRRVLHKLAKKH